jgi:hypothetical protein
VYFGLPKGNNDLNIINEKSFDWSWVIQWHSDDSWVNILQHIWKALNKNTLQIEEWSHWSLEGNWKGFNHFNLELPFISLFISHAIFSCVFILLVTLLQSWLPHLWCCDAMFLRFLY